MNTAWSPRGRAERLVAVGRLFLAVVSLVAIYLDPTEPVLYTGQTYALLVAYALFSIVAALVAWRAPATMVRLGLAIHALDLVVYSLLVFLTDSPTSPFFAWFVFALFSATLRSGRRGIVWTSLIAITIFILMGAATVSLHPEQSFELNRFLIRAAYLAVVAALLIYLADYQASLQTDLLSLSVWPRFESLEFQEVATDILDRSTGMFRAPRAILLIRERETAGWLGVLWNAGKAVSLPIPTGSIRDDVRGSFVTMDFRSKSPGLALVNGKIITLQSHLLRDDLIESEKIKSVLGISLDGSSFDGWLLLLDREQLSAEDLTLGDVLRHPVVAQIDAHLMARRAERTAIATERVRLAQQLHDGLLQSMAGIVHYLEVVHKVLESDPAAARKKVTEVQGLLMEDQRNLRMFLQQLTPPAFRAEGDLTNQLHELAERLRRQWQLKIDLRLQSIGGGSSKLRSSIYNLMSEALFNVVKHAEATSVVVRLESNHDFVRLSIEDDGRGFPFAGRFSLRELDEIMSGPVSIKRRVAASNGDLTLDTGSHGSRLEIELPFEPENG